LRALALLDGIVEIYVPLLTLCCCCKGCAVQYQFNRNA